MTFCSDLLRFPFRSVPVGGHCDLSVVLDPLGINKYTINDWSEVLDKLMISQDTGSTNSRARYICVNHKWKDAILDAYQPRDRHLTHRFLIFSSEK